MIIERTFRLTPLADEMLTRVQRYADVSPDEALNELVQYGFVAYRMTVMHQMGFNPADGSILDLPERPHETDAASLARPSADITEDNAQALESVSKREGVAITAATRLLLRLGYVVYHAIKIEGHEVVIDDGKHVQPIELDQ